MSSHEPDEIDDDLLRRAIQARDPAYGKALEPPTLTLAQIRMLGEARRTRKQPWHAAVLSRLSRRKLLIGGMATIGAVAAAYLLAPSAAIAAPGMLDIDFSGPAQPASDQLRQLAKSIAADAAIEPPRDSTTQIHLQRWSMDTIHPASELLAEDIQIWWRPDRSGEEINTTLPAQQTDQRLAEYLDQLPPGSKPGPNPIKYGPGEFSTLISTPSSDPIQLKSQLDHHEPPENGPQATLRAVADVTALHHLSGAQRIAFLAVLADIPELAWRGSTTDRAGRPCIALSIDSGSSSTGLKRDILLIGITGKILGHELIALTPPPRSPISRNTVIEYTLHLKSEWLPL